MRYGFLGINLPALLPVYFTEQVVGAGIIRILAQIFFGTLPGNIKPAHSEIQPGIVQDQFAQPGSENFGIFYAGFAA
jgi:hypothetical protein